MRICFVGQENYFKEQVESDLDELYDVVWKNITFGIGDWEELLEVQADVWVFFMPHTVPGEILNQLEGVVIGKHAEPLPKFVGLTYFESRDTLKRMADFVPKAGAFKNLYHHDKTSIPVLEREGVEAKEMISPIATGKYYPEDLPKEWDVTLIAKETPYRQHICMPIKHEMCGRFLHIAHGIHGDELRRVLNKSKIGLNVHTENLPALENRVQIMMANGLFVLSQPLSHNDFFKPGVHFVQFNNTEDLREKIDYYLKHEDERESIAQAGHEFVKKELAAKVVWPRLFDEALNETDSQAG